MDRLVAFLKNRVFLSFLPLMYFHLIALLGTITLGVSLFCNGTIVSLALCSSRYIIEADTSADVIDASRKLCRSMLI